MKADIDSDIPADTKARNYVPLRSHALQCPYLCPLECPIQCPLLCPKFLSESEADSRSDPGDVLLRRIARLPAYAFADDLSVFLRQRQQEVRPEREREAVCHAKGEIGDGLGRIETRTSVLRPEVREDGHSGGDVDRLLNAGAAAEMELREVLRDVGVGVADRGADERSLIAQRHARGRRRGADGRAATHRILERAAPLHGVAEVPAGARAGIAQPALLQPADAQRRPCVRLTEAATRSTRVDD